MNEVNKQTINNMIAKIKHFFMYGVVKRFFKHKHKFQVRGVNRFGTPTYQVCLKCRKSFERVNKSYEKEKWQECEKILELDKQFDKNDRYIF